VLNCINIRDFAEGKHRQVDDYPYGGGAGMVMMASPIYSAFMSIGCPDATFLYMSPQGAVFNQKMACELATKEDIIILCGHYEGVDQRILDLLKPTEISMGDYILTGGELAALTIIDATSRLIPAVVGNSESTASESFSERLDNHLEYPQYTRPFTFMGMEVPQILTSGNHALIEKWRKKQSLETTLTKRPDLI